ncbi:MAG TPA: hypothetical protein GXX75_12555 [Clostridiales bacterium]|nr:hypothetical protein [Clostridiales bacterium]
MKQNVENEIAIRDKLIDGLEREGRIKDELIQSQKEMIRILEDHNAELAKLIENMILPQ